MEMTRAAASLLLVACAAPDNAPPAAPATTAGPNDALAASIDALATDVLVKTPAAGIAVAVSWHGETVVARGYGLADAERPTPATAETVFRIGSITKQFTAAAILAVLVDTDGSFADDLVEASPAWSCGRPVRRRRI
jgi:D-alanyl-D-alanine carboxypeptidase